MTYIKSTRPMMDDDEILGVHLHNTREWLEDAKQQAYRNPTSVAFAVQELTEAVEFLGGLVVHMEES